MRPRRARKRAFSHNALETTNEKLKVFAVQGFGRFGPFGPSESNSKVRYEGRQDWGAVLWWPVVLFGLVHIFRLGRSQLRAGRPPTAVAGLIWAAVAWFVVAAYLPMAWDRYLLPIQAPNALLAAVGVSALWDRLKEPIRAAWRRFYAPAVWVFVILLGSYAFFWHSRDWNTASRLMLTYAMVDRGTVSITGLDRQTGDKAKFDGHYYSDKLPGYLVAGDPALCVRQVGLRLAESSPRLGRDPLLVAPTTGSRWGPRESSRPGLPSCSSLLARDLGCRPSRPLPWSAWPMAFRPRPMSMRRWPTATRPRRSPCSARFSCSGGTSPGTKALRVFLAGFLAAYAVGDRASARARSRPSWDCI